MPPGFPALPSAVDRGGVPRHAQVGRLRHRVARLQDRRADANYATSTFGVENTENNEEFLDN